MLVFGITLGFLSFLLLKRSFPLWYEYSIFHHLEVAGSSFKHMFKQTKSFIKYYWILFLFYLLWVHKHSSEFNFKKIHEIRLIPFHIKEPFIRGITIELADLGIFISALILTLYLGKHGGNFYTYYGELLLPFLIYSIIPKIDKLYEVKYLQSIVRILVLYFCVLLFQSNYVVDFAVLRNAFTGLYQYADQCNNIYDKTPLIALYKIDNNLDPIYNNGHTQLRKFHYS